MNRVPNVKQIPTWSVKSRSSKVLHPLPTINLTFWFRCGVGSKNGVSNTEALSETPYLFFLEIVMLLVTIGLFWVFNKWASMLSFEQVYTEAGLIKSRRKWFKVQELRKVSSDDTDQEDPKRVDRITRRNTRFNRDVGKLVVDGIESADFERHWLDEGLEFQQKYSSQKWVSVGSAFGPHFQNQEYSKLVISEASTAEWENMVGDSEKSVPQPMLDSSPSSKRKVEKHVRFDFS